MTGNDVLTGRPGGGVHDLALMRLEAMQDRLPGGVSARLLGPADDPVLRRFRVEVLRSLDDPDLYRTAGEVGDVVADHLGRVGLTAGLFANGRLIAYGSLGLPGQGDGNEGRELPIRDDELPAVAHIASAMVEAAWRGHGLHRWLIGWRLAVADALGRFHALTTVATRNRRSWLNLIGHGLLGKRVLAVAGGFELLLHRDTRDTPVLDPDSVQLCPVETLCERTDLSVRGPWLWGCRMSGDTPLAVLGRPRATGEVREPARATAAVRSMCG